MKRKPVILIGGLIIGFIIFLKFVKPDQKSNPKKETSALKVERPDVSIARLRIDSVDTAGNVFATELHAGESASAGDSELPIFFEPTNESKRWAQNKFYIPEEGRVFVLYFDHNGEKVRQLITPLW